MENIKLLVVVDCQNDFITGSLGSQDAQNIIPGVVDRILSAKENTLVIFTKDTHNEATYLDTQEGKNLPFLHCIENTSGNELHPSLQMARRIRFENSYNRKINCDSIIGQITTNGMMDVILEKNTFGSTDLVALVEYLNENSNIIEVEVCGLCTDICVITNVILLKTYLPEIPIYVDANLCAGVTRDSHERALEAMKMLQVNII